jgi:hypothetical protein
VETSSISLNNRTELTSTTSTPTSKNAYYRFFCNPSLLVANLFYILPDQSLKTTTSSTKYASVPTVSGDNPVNSWDPSGKQCQRYQYATCDSSWTDPMGMNGCPSDLVVSECEAFFQHIDPPMNEGSLPPCNGNCLTDLASATIAMQTANGMSIQTPLDFAKVILAMISAPDSPQNDKAMVAWEKAEGGNWNNPDKYNPLNTTEPYLGAFATNSAGVKSYPSWQAGVVATTMALELPYYTAIISALDEGNNAYAVANAVGSSHWGTPNFSNLLSFSISVLNRPQCVTGVFE